MRCIRCDSLDDKVIDSRMSTDGKSTRRRRECLKCLHRYTTHESIDSPDLRVVKRNGDRKVLDRVKILSGLMKACEKRPVPLDRLDHAVDEIVEELHRDHTLIVPSRVIGGKVMEKLFDIDAVAYVRYMSVYRQFDTVGEFINEIQKLNFPKDSGSLPSSPLKK